MLKERISSRLVWASVKAVYSGLIDCRDDWEIAETFFNSVTRRVFTTVGVDEEIEFVHTDYVSPPTPSKTQIYHTYTLDRPLSSLLEQLFSQYDFPLSETQIRQEAAIAVKELQSRLATPGELETIERLDVIKAPFYRGEHVHLIGRLTIADRFLPFVLCFRHTSAGVFLGQFSSNKTTSACCSVTRGRFFVSRSIVRQNLLVS